MINTRIENGGWRDLRVAWGGAGARPLGHRYEKSPNNRLSPLIPAITAYFVWGRGGRGILDLGLAILDWAAAGNKVIVLAHRHPLRTRSQGQSNLVKPNFMLGNLDWLKRDSEFWIWVCWRTDNGAKFTVPSSEFQVANGRIRPVFPRKTGFARNCSV